VTPTDDRPVSDAQIDAIKKTLKTDKEIKDCEGLESVDSVLQKLQFQRLPRPGLAACEEDGVPMDRCGSFDSIADE
jgi:hypothetical protein